AALHLRTSPPLPPDDSAPLVAGSPVPEATPAQWRAFAERMRVAPYSPVSGDNRLGAYEVGMRRLVDLGLAERPSQRVVRAPGEPPRHVWVAEWRPPYSEAGFLADERLQDEVLARDAAEKRAAILAQLPMAGGVLVDGEVATLSGLVAAATRASVVPDARHGGLSALGVWLASPAGRERFRPT